MVQVPKFRRPDVSRLHSLAPAQVNNVGESVARSAQALLGDISAYLREKNQKDAIRRGAEEGLTAGQSEEALKLRTDGSLRSEAFNKSAITSFSSRMDLQIRQDMARISRENEGNIAGLEKSFAAMQAGFLSSTPVELRPGVTSLIGKLAIGYRDDAIRLQEATTRDEALANNADDIEAISSDILRQAATIEDDAMATAVLAEDLADIVTMMAANGPKGQFELNGQVFPADPTRTGANSVLQIQQKILELEAGAASQRVLGKFDRTEDKATFLTEFRDDYLNGDPDLIRHISFDTFLKLETVMIKTINDQASVTKAEQFKAEAFTSDRIEAGDFVTDEEFISMVDGGTLTPSKAASLRRQQNLKQQELVEFAEMQVAFTLGFGESLDINNAKKQKGFDAFIAQSPLEDIIDNAINFGKENGMTFTPLKNKLNAATPNSPVDFQEVFTNIYLPLSNEGPDILDAYLPSKEQKAIFRAYEIALRAGIPPDEAVIQVRDIDFELASNIKTAGGQDIINEVFTTAGDIPAGLDAPATGFFGGPDNDLPPLEDFINSQFIANEIKAQADFFHKTGRMTSQQAWEEAAKIVKGTWVLYEDRLLPNLPRRTNDGTSIRLPQAVVSDTLGWFRETKLEDILITAFPDENQRPLPEDVILLPDHRTFSDGRLALVDKRFNTKVVITLPDGEPTSLRFDLLVMASEMDSELRAAEFLASELITEEEQRFREKTKDITLLPAPQGGIEQEIAIRQEIRKEMAEEMEKADNG